MRYWKTKLNDGPTVGIVVASYLNDDSRRQDALTCLLSSIVAQTYPNWSVKIVHDGPVDSALPANHITLDPRIDFICTPTRTKQHGHPHRREQALAPFTYKGSPSTVQQPEYIVFTNDDNYYMPVFLEWMLAEAIGTKSDFMYCDMVHSHRLWQLCLHKNSDRHNKRHISHNGNFSDFGWHRNSDKQDTDKPRADNS